MKRIKTLLATALMTVLMCGTVVSASELNANSNAKGTRPAKEETGVSRHINRNASQDIKLLSDETESKYVIKTGEKSTLKNVEGNSIIPIQVTATGYYNLAASITSQFETAWIAVSDEYLDRYSEFIFRENAASREAKNVAYLTKGTTYYLLVEAVNEKYEEIPVNMTVSLTANKPNVVTLSADGSTVTNTFGDADVFKFVPSKPGYYDLVSSFKNDSVENELVVCKMVDGKMEFVECLHNTRYEGCDFAKIILLANEEYYIFSRFESYYYIDDEILKTNPSTKYTLSCKKTTAPVGITAKKLNFQPIEGMYSSLYDEATFTYCIDYKDGTSSEDYTIWLTDGYAAGIRFDTESLKLDDNYEYLGGDSLPITYLEKFESSITVNKRISRFAYAKQKNVVLNENSQKTVSEPCINYYLFTPKETNYYVFYQDTQNGLLEGVLNYWHFGFWDSKNNELEYVAGLGSKLKAGETYCFYFDVGDFMVDESLVYRIAPNSKHIHRYMNEKVVKQATKTATGLKEAYCICGDVKQTVIPKLADTHVHSYGPMVVIKPATTKSTGMKQSTCSCGSRSSLIIPRLTLAIPDISKPKAAKKALTAKWKSVNGADGYQVQYSLKKNFKKAKSKKTSKVSYKIKKLKSRKKYYVRVRAYVKADDGKTYYSKWSSAKNIKVK